jgi:hypothetical protein
MMPREKRPTYRKEELIEGMMPREKRLTYRKEDLM